MRAPGLKHYVKSRVIPNPLRWLEVDEIERLDSVVNSEREALLADAYKEAAEIRRRAHDQVQRYSRRSRTQHRREMQHSRTV